MKDGIRSFALTVLRDEMHIVIPDDVGDEMPLGGDGLGLESLIILMLSIRAEEVYSIDLIPSYGGVLPASFGEFVDRVEMARHG